MPTLSEDWGGEERAPPPPCPHGGYKHVTETGAKSRKENSASKSTAWVGQSQSRALRRVSVWGRQSQAVCHGASAAHFPGPAEG